MTLDAVLGSWRVAAVVGERLCPVQASGELSQTVEAGPATSASPVVVTVEVRQATSGVMPWALIGAEFEPASDGIVSVRVPHSGELRAGAARTCVGPLGRALAAGVPLEFAEAALEGIVRESGVLPAGSLRVSAGGYDDADSSDRSFGCAGGVLVHAIAAASTGNLTTATLAAAIQHCCHGPRPAG